MKGSAPMSIRLRAAFGKRFLSSALIPLFAATVAAAQPAPSAQTAAGPDLDFPTILYGAAYYNEYMPGDQAARLDKDVALMKAAGLNVVRMGESTWSLWEPEDGRFEYAWMDHIVDAMGKAGIKVILGTPTYSIPAWMAHQHPEILADRIPGGARTPRGTKIPGWKRPIRSRCGSARKMPRSAASGTATG